MMFIMRWCIFLACSIDTGQMFDICNETVEYLLNVPLIMLLQGMFVMIISILCDDHIFNVKVLTLLTEKNFVCLQWHVEYYVIYCVFH